MILDGGDVCRLPRPGRPQEHRRSGTTHLAPALQHRCALACVHTADIDLHAQVHNKAARTAAVLSAHGQDVEVETKNFFDTIRLKVPDARAKVAELAAMWVNRDTWLHIPVRSRTASIALHADSHYYRQRITLALPPTRHSHLSPSPPVITPLASLSSINARLIDDTSIGLSFDETTDMGRVAELCEVFGVADAEAVRTQTTRDQTCSLILSLTSHLKPYLHSGHRLLGCIGTSMCSHPPRPHHP